MNPKIRRIFILVHLYCAAFMTPAFLLVAITGGNYLLGNKGSTQLTPIPLAANASLNFKSPTLEADVRTLLSDNNIDHKFEYVRGRGNTIHLRPTSKTYIEMKQTPDGLIANYAKPSLQAGLMELHKGHGPTLFKTYSKLVALALLIVVLGGVAVGLMAKAYRGKTLGALAIGTVIFFLTGFIA